MKHTSLWLVVYTVSHMVEWWKQPLPVSFKVTLVSFKKVLPSCHDHLSKALTPNIILLDVMILTYEFGDDKH